MTVFDFSKAVKLGRAVPLDWKIIKSEINCPAFTLVDLLISIQGNPLIRSDKDKDSMEILALGRSGLDVASPSTRYQLESLGGDFSGLQLVCYLYAAIQQFAPGTDVGFDLSKEYGAAKELEG